MSPHTFRDIQVGFATNHRKAQAATEPFQQILSSTIEEIAINSDSLGTFSGEIERPGSMIDALRGKIQLARAVTERRFIVASEGSFSSVSSIGIFVHGIEMLMFHDAQTGVEILEQYICYNSNYATATVRNRAELYSFLQRISFDSHALVLYPQGIPLAGNVSKGITDRIEAEKVFDVHCAQSPTKSVMAMSDMRAHANPTRMQSIRHCCELLAKRLNTICDKCYCGGFGLAATVPGLPCRECGLPTQRARGEIHSCPFCGNRKELSRSDSRTTADPAECEWCNP